MKNNILKLGVGVPIKDAAESAVELAKQKKSTITLAYNNVEIAVSPNTKPEYVVNAFFSKVASLPNMGIPQKTRGM